MLVYLTVLKLAGEAIGHRPLLTLGVLLVVVGMQFLSLGLLSELITSHHEERAAERRAARTRGTSTRSCASALCESSTSAPTSATTRATRR